MARVGMVLAFALLGCAEPVTVSVDAATSQPADAWAIEPDAGPGCFVVSVCIAPEGLVRYCPSVHAAVAESVMDDDPRTLNVHECRHWSRCGRGPSACYYCRDWSALAYYLEPPTTPPSDPPCSSPVCPVPDGGVYPRCSDAGY